MGQAPPDPTTATSRTERILASATFPVGPLLCDDPGRLQSSLSTATRRAVSLRRVMPGPLWSRRHASPRRGNPVRLPDPAPVSATGRTSSLPAQPVRLPRPHPNEPSRADKTLPFEPDRGDRTLQAVATRSRATGLSAPWPAESVRRSGPALPAPILVIVASPSKGGGENGVDRKAYGLYIDGEFSFPSAWGGRAAGLPPGLPQSDESVSDGSD